MDSAWAEYHVRPSTFTYQELLRYVPKPERRAWHEKGDGRGRERQFGIAHRIMARGEGSRTVDGTPEPRQRWRVGGTEPFCNGAGGEGSCQSAPRDRKSTRLNSSHLGISYAVFC